MVEIEGRLRVWGNSYCLTIPVAFVKYKIFDPSKPVKAIITQDDPMGQQFSPIVYSPLESHREAADFST